MSEVMNTVQREVQDTVQPFYALRQHLTLLDLDQFIFVEQGVSQVDRAARIRALALELELTASHLRRVLEESTL